VVEMVCGFGAYDGHSDTLGVLLSFLASLRRCVARTNAASWAGGLVAVGNVMEHASMRSLSDAYLDLEQCWGVDTLVPGIPKYLSPHPSALLYVHSTVYIDGT
jgi:hypothetical protein